jgi:cytochrome c
MAQAKPATERFLGIGRAATPAEVRAWDIDVRGDFAGLPKGSGSVAKGQEVWDAKCASCHGVFGESNEVFPPIVGGTTKKDSETGRVAALVEGANSPQRTTLMKLSKVSALWDYIHRAMPWNAPKTLTVEEVYATTAYILNLGGLVPDNFVLSDQNIAQVQAILPNRNGKSVVHGKWLASGRPDVQGSACMNNCQAEPKLASLIPAYARDAHGNLAEQNRAFGPLRGADTTKPSTVKLAVATPAASAAAGTVVASAPAGAPDAAGPDPAAVLRLAQRHTCTACHGVDNKMVGPSFRQMADRYKGRGDAVDYMAGKIRAGSAGVWGAIPMPAQAQVSAADARALAEWIAAGARR